MQLSKAVRLIPVRRRIAARSFAGGVEFHIGELHEADFALFAANGDYQILAADEQRLFLAIKIEPGLVAPNLRGLREDGVSLVHPAEGEGFQLEARVEIDDGDLEEGIVDVAIGDEGRPDPISTCSAGSSGFPPNSVPIWTNEADGSAPIGDRIGWRDSNPRPLRAERNRLTLQVSNGTD
jgi:hypothetical protein